VDLTRKGWHVYGWLGGFGAAFAVFAHLTFAQDVPRIGFLSALNYEAFPSRIDAFQRGLKDLGYVEGKNIIVEYRWADGRIDRLPALAAELESKKVAVIVSAGPSATGPARRSTKATPIVMAFDSDPVGSGFVDSLARPGGRITGLSYVAPEMSGKHVDILRQIIPGLADLAILGDSREPGNARAVAETRVATGALGMKAHYIDARSSRNMREALSASRQAGAQAAVVLSSPLFTGQALAGFLDEAAKQRLPVIYWFSYAVERGGLMSYSANMDDLFRRSASYVDKILKGAKPADLPVEQPSTFELVINLRAATAIGLTIPGELLARANRVLP
jgi:putative tryptophan/tyrosine transport system substrate-binding protein